MVPLIVIASRDLPRVKAALKELGGGTLIPRQIGKEVRSAVPPIRDAARASARATLPKRGGLNEWVASATVRGTVRYGARSAGIHLRMGRNSARKRSDLAGIERGLVRHPVYGHRDRWVAETVPPKFFQRAIDMVGLHAFRDACNAAIRAAIRKVGL